MTASGLGRRLTPYFILIDLVGDDEPNPRDVDSW